MSALEWLDAVRADLDALTRSRHIASSSGLTSDELTEAWKAVLSLGGHVATIAPDRLDRMERALRGVMAMHRPEPQEVNTADGFDWLVFCRECGLEWGDAGCPTVTTIREALSDE